MKSKLGNNQKAFQTLDEDLVVISFSKSCAESLVRLFEKFLHRTSLLISAHLPAVIRWKPFMFCFLTGALLRFCDWLFSLKAAGGVTLQKQTAEKTVFCKQREPISVMLRKTGWNGFERTKKKFFLEKAWVKNVKEGEHVRDAPVRYFPIAYHSLISFNHVFSEAYRNPNFERLKLRWE